MEKYFGKTWYNASANATEADKADHRAQCIEHVCEHHMKRTNPALHEMYTREGRFVLRMQCWNEEIFQCFNFEEYRAL